MFNQKKAQYCCKKSYLICDLRQLNESHVTAVSKLHEARATSQCPLHFPLLSAEVRPCVHSWRVLCSYLFSDMATRYCQLLHVDLKLGNTAYNIFYYKKHILVQSLAYMSTYLSQLSFHDQREDYCSCCEYQQYVVKESSTQGQENYFYYYCQHTSKIF